MAFKEVVRLRRFDLPGNTTLWVDNENLSKSSGMPRTTISLTARSNGEFRIHKENRWVRFFRRIGLAGGVKLEGEGMKGYYLETGNPAALREFLSKTKNRKLIQTLFDEGAYALNHDGRMLTATWYGFEMRTCSDADAKRIGGTLAKLSEDLEEAFRSSNPLKTFLLRVAVLPAIAILMLSFLAFALWAHWSDVYACLQHSRATSAFLGAGWVAWALLVAVTYFAARGRSRGYTYFLSAFFLGMIQLLPLSMALGSYINGRWDQAPFESRQARVIQMQAPEGKVKRYRVWVNADPIQSFELTVSRSEFERIKVGQSIELQVKPGALGYAWLYDYVVPEAPHL